MLSGALNTIQPTNQSVDAVYYVLLLLLKSPSRYIQCMLLTVISSLSFTIYTNKYTIAYIYRLKIMPYH